MTVAEGRKRWHLANQAVYLAFLKPGDKVEIEISQIGVLRNKVAASKK